MNLTLDENKESHTETYHKLLKTKNLRKSSEHLEENNFTFKEQQLDQQQISQ